MTEQTTETKRPKEYLHNALRIVTNLKELYPELQLSKYAVVAPGDSFDLLKFFLTGEMNQTVAERIVTAAYGTNGKPLKRVKSANGIVVDTLTMPIITDKVTEAFEAIPKEELVVVESETANRVPLKEKLNSAKEEAKKETMINTAKAMLKFNVAMEIVMSTTGLTEEEITALKGE